LIITLVVIHGFRLPVRSFVFITYFPI